MSFSEKLKKCGISFDELKNSVIMITGASGMIGSVLAENLMELDEELSLGINLLLLIRNKNKLDK